MRNPAPSPRGDRTDAPARSRRRRGKRPPFLTIAFAMGLATAVPTLVWPDTGICLDVLAATSPPALLCLGLLGTEDAGRAAASLAGVLNWAAYGLLLRLVWSRLRWELGPVVLILFVLHNALLFALVLCVEPPLYFPL